MQIDFKKFNEQRKKNILEGNEYCRLEVVVGKNEKNGIAEIEIEQVTDNEIGLLLKILNETEKSLIKNYPKAYRIATEYDINTREINLGNNTEEE